MPIRNRNMPACFGAAVCLVLISATPLLAGSTLFTLGGTELRVGVESMKERQFRGVIPQQFDFSCGSAALATLLTHHYETPTSERQTLIQMFEKGDQPEIRKVGFSLLDMRRYLESVGLRADGFRIDLEKLAELGIPAIALIEVKGYKHFVVIKGVEEGRVLIGDPALGLKVIHSKKFLKSWNGIIFLIRNKVPTARANFNKQAEWEGLIGMRGSVALDQQTLHSLTSHVQSKFDFDRY